jgi:hypothetical protein
MIPNMKSSPSRGKFASFQNWAGRAQLGYCKKIKIESSKNHDCDGPERNICLDTNTYYLMTPFLVLEKFIEGRIFEKVDTHQEIVSVRRFFSQQVQLNI